MSDCIQVFLNDSKLPTVAEWNAAIRAKGYAFDLIIAPFDLHQDHGYRPVRLNDYKTGFGWELEELNGTNRSEKPQLLDCDRRAELRYTSHADEIVTAFFAGAVLAELTSGYFVNSRNGDELLAGPEAVNSARDTIREWRRRGPHNSGENITERALSQPPDSLQAMPTPRVRLYYLFFCTLHALIWSGYAAWFFMIFNGVITPPWEYKDKLLAGASSVLIVAIIFALIAVFYASALFVRRKPAGWLIGGVAILGMIIPFYRISWLVVLPLLHFWGKPENTRFFSKKSRLRV